VTANIAIADSLKALDFNRPNREEPLRSLFVPPHSFYALPTTDSFTLLKECVGAVSLAGLMFKPLTNTKTCVFFLKKRSKEIQDIGSTTLR
jgi:hypothetical protein